ncbi:cobalt ABC transporter permease [Synechococcus sp. WH 8101]|uniref:CbiQ family ECF transporter T component n=1 Tax=Synechococcus sp. WH 8101 TaxID=59932 RepID=UPI001022F998|nr:CbiQ family ECF transporter T component [Synechococcus sp. WH 8101]QBE68212.1 cobalt ABC transporter permease [Synechococcus sp. WH 8101]QNI44423.1 transmembrane component of ECF transporter energizing module [Synechococcus sp. WH 8101]
MDWLRQIPIGQYVDGSSSWLRRLDPRLKLAWVLLFLLTPVLAGPLWRLGLLGLLLLLTLFSGLPPRLWWRSLLLLSLLGVGVGLLAALLPTGDPAATLPLRSPQELPDLTIPPSGWELLRLGPLKLGPFTLGPFVVDRRSAELGLSSATLIVTVVHSVNLMLLTTPSEELVWALSWLMAPLAVLGLPVDRLSFQLLLALRFLPLVQEELQNLLRALASRAVNLKSLGFKASFGLVLAVAERLLANILLRAEQGADALLVRGGRWCPAAAFRPAAAVAWRDHLRNGAGVGLLLLLLGLRGKYGAL